MATDDEDAARFDFYKHAIAFDTKKSSSRCKQCQRTTHVECLKCGVHLCFVKGRNCFNAYHGYPENPANDFFSPKD